MPPTHESANAHGETKNLISYPTSFHHFRSFAGLFSSAIQALRRGYLLNLLLKRESKQNPDVCRVPAADQSKLEGPISRWPIASSVRKHRTPKWHKFSPNPLKRSFHQRSLRRRCRAPLSCHPVSSRMDRRREGERVLMISE